MEAVFNHIELALFKPDFDSELTSLIIKLDHLRSRHLMGTTHPHIFFQLKHIFHTLESIGSARIEGNNTTIVEYIEEVKLESTNPSRQFSSDIQEIYNMEKAMDFVEESIRSGHPINRMFISELHKKIMDKLNLPSQGVYRVINVNITKSSHKPPDVSQVSAYMDELFTFINQECEPKFDLLKTAIAHHRFAWIHPFPDGNGRTVRLLTYAMLVKQGFNLHQGRIVNPTAIFCSNRNNYYEYLSMADSGTKEGMYQWCEYVLRGLVHEIEKIDCLLDYSYLSHEILKPALSDAFEQKYVTDIELKILLKLIEKNNQILKANDIKMILPKEKSATEISRIINRLKEKRMLIPEKPGARKYCLSFDNNYLLRSVIKQLSQKGFLPFKDGE